MSHHSIQFELATEAERTADFCRRRGVHFGSLWWPVEGHISVSSKSQIALVEEKTRSVFTAENGVWEKLVGVRLDAPTPRNSRQISPTNAPAGYSLYVKPASTTTAQFRDVRRGQRLLVWGAPSSAAAKISVSTQSASEHSGGKENRRSKRSRSETPSAAPTSPQCSEDMPPREKSNNPIIEQVRANCARNAMVQPLYRLLDPKTASRSASRRNDGEESTRRSCRERKGRNADSQASIHGGNDATTRLRISVDAVVTSAARWRRLHPAALTAVFGASFAADSAEAAARRSPTSHVALFRLERTLLLTSPFVRGVEAWQLAQWPPSGAAAPQALRALAEAGYSLLLYSHYPSLHHSEATLVRETLGRIERLVDKHLKDLPIVVMLCITSNLSPSRSLVPPSQGLWNLFVDQVNNGVKPNMVFSFLVGDDDVDEAFAQELGLPFYTVEKLASHPVVKKATDAVDIKDATE